MNKRFALRLQNLGKLYRIGRRRRARTLGETLRQRFRSPRTWFRKDTPGPSEELFWALRDVSFQVEEGEVVGVIGKNGAGKSTVLKILSRITEPSTGQAEVRGRVASLLEVGIGFHPELSGRENVFLNGAILGMQRSEIVREFDAMVDFAGVDRFIDTPVKHYSSGMYMRLAFAVAAHLQPEILLVDEVLAVGDASFQKKCLGKMSTVARQGRTILFVSHNMLAVESLCHRVLWLERGRLKADGRPAQVISSYLEESFSAATERRWEPAQAPGSRHFRLSRARVTGQGSDPSSPVTTRSPLSIEFEYLIDQPGSVINLNLQLFNQQEILVFEAGPNQEPIWRPLPAGVHRDVCHVPGDLLNSGMHRVALYVVEGGNRQIYRDDEVLVFEVRDDVSLRGGWYGEWGGVVRPRLRWTRQLLEESRSLEEAERSVT